MCFAIFRPEIQREFILDDEQNVDDDASDEEEGPENKLDFLYLFNPLDLGQELDMDNDNGSISHVEEDDMHIDMYLQILAMYPHYYCNINSCPSHGAFFIEEENK